MNGKITVVTYGSGHPRYVKGRQLTAFSAKHYGADRVIECDRSDLDPDFYDRHESILSQPRGAGYWLWKPYLISKFMDQMEDGEVLFYLDGDQVIHCELKPLVFQALEQQPMIFRGLANRYCDAMWTKADLLNALNLLNRRDLILTGQHEGGRQLILVNEFTRAVTKKILEFCTVPHFLTDTPSVTPNLEGFVEHRHDQSIFSAITKLVGLRTFDWTEQFWRLLCLITDDIGPDQKK
jgi:hypothetical protein